MIKAIIIDDEINCINALEEDLQMFCPDVMLLDVCQSAKEGILSIRRNNPELVFLDIEMPWMNGFEMLEILNKEINFQIVFTTAYDQFAIKAFKVSAVDYLLKPIDSEDLVNALARVRKEAWKEPEKNKINNLLENTKTIAVQQKIAVPSKEGYHFIPVDKIIYCKAKGSYTELTLEDNTKLVLSKSLGETQAILPSELFERIHHSALVNLLYIDQYKKIHGFCIVMKNGDELSVSKSKKEQLLIRLGVR